jgi:hypothetical protein
MKNIALITSLLNLFYIYNNVDWIWF